MKQLISKAVSKDKIDEILSALTNTEFGEECYEDFIDDIRDIAMDTLTGGTPEIKMSSDVYQKMMNYVYTCDKEIGWHGIVEREGNVFTIKDVLLYPQCITATTVKSDPSKMPQWILEHSDVASSIRFQGHSHVNMSTSPSGVDNTDQMEWVNMVDDYYVFMIVNKKREYFAIIYDKVNNWVYETKDIAFTITTQDIEIETKEEIKSYLSDKPPVIPKPVEQPKKVDAPNSDDNKFCHYFFESGVDIEKALNEKESK